MIQITNETKVTLPITVFAEPVNTNQAEKRPTKVQISTEKVSGDIFTKLPCSFH
jgi:hypothetical protein